MSQAGTWFIATWVKLKEHDPQVHMVTLVLKTHGGHVVALWMLRMWCAHHSPGTRAREASIFSQGCKQGSNHGQDGDLGVNLASAWRPEGGEWVHMGMNVQETFNTDLVARLEKEVMGGCFPTPLGGRTGQFFKKMLLTQQGYFLIVVSKCGPQECGGGKHVIKAVPLPSCRSLGESGLQNPHL